MLRWWHVLSGAADVDYSVAAAASHSDICMAESVKTDIASVAEGECVKYSQERFKPLLELLSPLALVLV
jgi:hypothetical protein